uniref:SWI/SNF-related matrix-associated actin-dependent regulator of chromatin subfamily A-like protein 1 n=1 Tax=Dermatophagoides pteronyssinus TaxID=6956 RepID=A0A6P6Y5U2_DERPT|nr:SWI/SNF-related matrix-associated actin-dependent regulator of chromatin subfamily A-like protein 1 [Dermatophagoides pteronyssinus]
MDTIDEETLKMIEEKRQKAIELLKRKREQQQQQQQEQQRANSVNNQPDDGKSTSKYFRTENEKRPMNNVSNSNSNQNAQPNSFTQLNDRNKSTKTNGIASSTSLPSKPPKRTIKMSVKLLNKSRFHVEFTYEEEIIKKFKHYETRQYDPIKKTWSFSLTEFSRFMTDMKELNGKNIMIVFEKSLSESLIKILIENQNMRKLKIDLSEKLDDDFLSKLYPYQRDGIIFGVQRNGKCLIADDMGLGKTIQSIGIAKWFRNDWPLIIICPSSLRYQWKEKLLEYFPDINESDIFIATKVKEIFPRVSITITSYDLIVRMKDRLTIETNRFYRMIIMDESHYIKSDDSQRTNVATQIAQSCNRIILLTGTPALSRPIELFPQVNLIAPELFPSKHTFGQRYCQAKQQTFFRNGRSMSVWNYKGADNLDELRIILENTIMIRRLKKDVLNELPTKKREMFLLSMDHLTEKELAVLNYHKGITKNSKQNNQRQMVAFEWFHKTAELKIQAVNEYLKELVNKTDDDTQIICFCHHSIMMNAIEDMLKKKISYIRINGTINAKNRQQACDTFQNEKKYKVALLSLTACATGLNLTSASIVIFTELYWTPGVLAQAEDRAHRIGQSKNVDVIYLVAKNTMDEMLWPMLSKKLETLNKAGLSRDTYDGTFNPLDMADENQSLLTEFFNYLDNENNLNDNPTIETSKQPAIESMLKKI